MEGERLRPVVVVSVSEDVNEEYVKPWEFCVTANIACQETSWVLRFSDHYEIIAVTSRDACMRVDNNEE